MSNQTTGRRTKIDSSQPDDEIPKAKRWDDFLSHVDKSTGGIAVISKPSSQRRDGFLAWCIRQVKDTRND